MEIALRSEILTYAGGFGVLAGDPMRTAVDLGLPLVAVMKDRISHSHRMMRHYATEAYLR